MTTPRKRRRGREVDKPKRRQRPAPPAAPDFGTHEPDADSRALLGDDPEQRTREPGPEAEGSIEDPLHDWPEDD
jgi:hypothetical protein